jgi:hypothetical protein
MIPPDHSVFHLPFKQRTLLESVVVTPPGHITAVCNPHTVYTDNITSFHASMKQDRPISWAHPNLIAFGDEISLDWPGERCARYGWPSKPFVSRFPPYSGPDAGLNFSLEHEINPLRH